MRTIRAELKRLGRWSVILSSCAVVCGFGLLATILVILTAGDSQPASSPTGGDSVLVGKYELSLPSGSVQGFSVGTMFLGIVVFGVSLALTSTEFTRGTMRTLLVRQPSRARIVGSKFVSMALVLALSLVAAEVVSIGAAVILADLRGIDSTAWFSESGISSMATALGNAFLACVLFGSVGMAIALFLPSTALALGVGLAWLGPVEHIVQLSWAQAGAWFPGLLFDAVVVGGNSVTTYQRAVWLALAFSVLFFGAATTMFIRRDMTS